MIDIKVHFATKVIQSGIKKIIVCGKILVVFDTESNIHLFDIIRKEDVDEESDI